MTNEKNNIRVYILFLSIATGAVLATMYIHYMVINRSGRIDLGDATHGFISIHHSKIGLAEARSAQTSTASSSISNNMAGNLTGSVGNIGQ